MPFTLPRRRLALPLIVIALLVAPVLAAQNGHAAERAQLLTSRACDGCNLSGETFDRMNLKGVSLSDATLVGAKFYRADLTNANLAGADLTGAVMSFADLSNANLGGTKLAGANLSGAIAADLAAAITSNTTTCPDGQAGPCR